ncbi:MAG: hypothetical protein A2Y76_01990 [Planctomycetes bacterium RBG_13_60_9]|nr:MAG: hypothetical protein A2Y76_01990 [Planctomycetes bacterium RBG_13_60_9]
MGTPTWVRISMSIVGLFCGSLFAGVEEMFAGIQSPPAETGLVLEIAVPKPTCFVFESVTVFARFRNTGDNTIALVLEDDGRRGIANTIRWNLSVADGKRHVLYTSGSMAEHVLLIPGHGMMYVALPDKMFPTGMTELSIEYQYSQDSSQPPLAGTEIWQGTIRSNTIAITSENKETLTPDEQKQVREEISRHIALFRSGDSATAYLAENHLVALSKYSVPILLTCLKDEDFQVRAHAIRVLGRIANRGGAEAEGFVRDVSSLDDLIATYDRERDPEIKERVIGALLNFDDMPSEKHRRIVRILREALSHTNKSLRNAGGAVLLRVSPNDGIPEVIDKMSDPAYFGEEQRNTLELLKKATGQDFGTSTNKWKAWWQENKDKITAGD